MRGFTRFLRILFWILVTVFLVWVSVSNRQPVFINFMVLNTSVETKVFVVYFLGIFTGLLMAGAVTGWLRLKGFVARRKAERQSEALRQDMATMQENLHKAESKSARTTPVEQIETRPDDPN